MRLAEGGDFTTKLHTKNHTSIIRIIVLRSTAPPLLLNRCYQLAFCRPCLVSQVCKGFRCQCQNCVWVFMCRLCVGCFKNFRREGRKKLKFLSGRKRGMLFPRTLVSVSAMSGLRDVLDPVCWQLKYM